MRVGIALALLLISIAFRSSMELWPEFLFCFGFWAAALVSNVLLYNFLLLPGMSCNAIAMLTNGGVMPVYGQEISAPGVHVQGTAEASLPFLCDWLPGGFSPGDVLILLALIWMIARYFVRHPVTVA
jgi:hypothetical protein